MPIIACESIGSYAGGSRWDAEYYARADRAFTEAMFAGWPEWRLLDEAKLEMSSGHTPSDHDLEVGSGGLITIDCVDPLFLDRSRLKHVLREHVDGELKRSRVDAGDVVVTIKRRLLNASPVVAPVGPMACNQDVVRIKPAEDVLPGFLAAVLNSRIGKVQAARNATEQINPYLSVPALKAIQVPRVDPAAQAPIHALTMERLAEFDACMRLEREAEECLSDALKLTDVSLRARSTALSTSSSFAGHERLDAEYFCFPDVAATWASPFELVPLADARVTSFIGSGATPAASDYADDGVPIIKVGSVSSFGLAEWRGDRVHPDAPAATGDRGRCMVNDIVMLSAAHHVRYIGRAGLVRRLPDGLTECRSVGELITVRPSGRLSPETLTTYLNLPPVRQQIQRLVRGQSAHLYADDLGSLPVPLVPHDVQDEVGQRLRSAFAHRTRAADLATEALGRVEQLILGGCST